jgi:hypothetical protein
MLALGDPHEIALAYNELNFGRIVETAPGEDAQRHGDRAAAEIRDAWFENEAGHRITAIPQGGACVAVMDVAFHTPMDAPIFAFHLRNEPRHTVFVTSTAWRGDPVGDFAAGESARVRVRFDNWLAPNRYTLTPSVARAGTGTDYVDLREDLAALSVHGTRVTGGIADVPHEISVERT